MADKEVVEKDPLAELYASGIRGNEKSPFQRKQEATAKAKADADAKVKAAAEKKKGGKPAALFAGGKKIVHNKFKRSKDGKHYLVPAKLFDGAKADEGDDAGE